MNLEILKGSENYVATVVTINNLHPIEGADKIQRTVVLGNNVIVSKDVSIGDRMIYFVSGTKLNAEFCKYNDLLTDAEQNRNKVAGYISHKQFRVKAIRLRSVISDGMLLPLRALVDFYNRIEVESTSDNRFAYIGMNYGANIEESMFNNGDTFNSINGLLLCEKYIVPERGSSTKNKRVGQQPTYVSRLVDNQFYLHNDTDNLRRNIHKLELDDVIGIHYKKHGCSAVIGNVLVKRQLSWLEKLAKLLGVKVVDTEYDIIYSSRKVVKNKNFNPTVSGGYYNEDIWGVVKNEVGNLVPKGYTLYGEILGYTPSGSFIQDKYDYGCSQGTHKFYVYKISFVNPDGKVHFLTDRQIGEFCDKYGINYSDTFIYYGTIENHLKVLTELGIEYDSRDWRDKYLQYLEDTYNEKDCYMCANKVPEEGIVLRVEKLDEYVAYKLKSKRFTLMESDLQEKEISNIEDNNE